MQLLAFLLDAQRYALPLEAVQRIVAAVEVTPLPGAPPTVHGAIDVEGEVVPVFNLRRRFGLPEQEIGPEHQFLLARSQSRSVALVIDEAQGVLRCDADAVTSLRETVPGLEQAAGVVRLEDGLVVIHDLESFLSVEESRSLDEALERSA